jgi:signal transduction histidine kinase
MSPAKVMSVDDPRELWFARLLDVGRSLVTELDADLVLGRVLETAREVTGARYAAIGVLNDQRTELSRFLTAGVDEQTHHAIGDLPTGRGVLGVLIEHPEPLRLTDVGRHPRSYGFPAAHPQMRSFLGAPIVIRGEAWGNLYLAEKEQSSEFSEQDERAAVILADWAAVAINNARLYEASELRRQEAEKAVRSLEVTRDVAVAIGSEIALEHVLELIAKRGRALVDAKSLVIMLREGEDLVVHASAGHVQDQRGTRLPVVGSTSGLVLERGRPERVADVDARLRIARSEFGVTDAHTALLVPMLYRGEALGLLAAFDRGFDSATFREDDEQMLHAFAASAGTAVALAQSVLADRLRSTLSAADAERKRWARELHDETLQGLAGLRLLLSAVLRGDDLPQAHAAMRDAVKRVEVEIENLRSIITDLRPAALDELGLRAAIEALLDRHREQNGLTIEHNLTIPTRETEDGRLNGDLETAVYRIVQEALTNVVKHANAEKVRLAIREHDGALLVEVQDDGVGFDTTTVDRGFGLTGIEERVSLAGGELGIDSNDGGTLLSIRLPAQRSGKRDAGDRAELPGSEPSWVSRGRSQV